MSRQNPLIPKIVSCCSKARTGERFPSRAGKEISAVRNARITRFAETQKLPRRVVALLLWSAVLALMLAFSSGPALAQRLHNQDRDNMAQDIKKQFDDFTSPENDIFEQAVRLATASEEEDLKQVRERTRVLQDSLAATLPLMTWDELRSQVFSTRRFSLAIYSGLESGVSGGFAGLQAEQEDLQKQIDQYDDAMHKQGDLIHSLQTALDSAVQGHRKLAFDVRGLPAAIAEWQGDLDHLRQIVLRLTQGPSNYLTQELVLLRFRSELQRIQLQKEHRKSRLAALGKLRSDIETYAGTAPGEAGCLKSGESYEGFGQFSHLLVSLCDAAHDPTQPVIDEIRRDSDLAGTGGPNARAAAQRLRQTLFDLAGFMHLAGGARYELLAEAMALSHDDLMYQVRQAQSTLHEHEALLRDGIHGIASFEAGGIRPGDFMTLFLAGNLLMSTATMEAAK